MSTALVTGANRGIGFEYCKQLAERGADVIAVCRASSSELDSLGVRVESGVDVTSAADIESLAAKLGDTTIDLLVNNAGVLAQETLDNFDFDSIQRQFEVNSMGPLRVTAALLPRMTAGSKIAMMTSRMGSIADNTSGARYGYRMSKVALNIAAVSLAHDLRERGIAVAILHPGWIQTGMTGNTGNATASDAARDLICRIDELTMDNSGTFWHSNGEVLPW